MCHELSADSLAALAMHLPAELEAAEVFCVDYRGTAVDRRICSLRELRKVAKKGRLRSWLEMSVRSVDLAGRFEATIQCAEATLTAVGTQRPAGSGPVLAAWAEADGTRRPPQVAAAVSAEGMQPQRHRGKCATWSPKAEAMAALEASEGGS